MIYPCEECIVKPSCDSHDTCHLYVDYCSYEFDKKMKNIHEAKKEALRDDVIFGLVMSIIIYWVW